MNKIAWLTIIVIVLIASAVSYADVKLPAVIADNMVLQQKANAPVWGWADPGEKISIIASWKNSAKTTTGKDGKWKLKLKTPKAGGPYDITITGKNTIKLQNILIGEVWLCSGQSNMQWSMSKTENADQHIATANYPNIRLFTVKRDVADQPKDDCTGNWSQCSPENVANFSAVAYFFGKHLQDELDIPIGLINTSWGGTPAEAWTRKEFLQKNDILTPILERHEHQIERLPKALEKYPLQYENWKKQAEKAKAEGKNPPYPPQKPAIRNQRSPSSLYNAMIAPIIPYAIKGAIWYQGEANVDRSWQYRTLFPAMIKNWRQDWNQGDFSFYYVQLAPFNYNSEKPSQELREAQLATLSLKNTGMAVTMDIGNPTDIHPTNKLDVGKRLALWALAKDYRKKGLVYSGPLYRSMKIEGDKIRLSFNHTGSGLTTRDGKELTHFTIATEDKNFVQAKAAIDGKTVIVSSEGVKKPVAVRYGWSNAAQPNLANKEGLPASSFRTDKWPGKTHHNR